MIDLATPLLGPLAVPECRRVARRPWPIVARSLAGLIAAIATVVAFWTWWLSAQVNPNHLPYVEFRVALVIVEGIAITVALVLAPAYLAGTIAGEKERGSIGLLLTTDASPRDIVLGRLAAGLGQVAMIVLATTPLMLGLAAMAGIEPGPLLALVALPAAVGFGTAGLALGASSISRRGRDALMLVYLLLAVSLFAPMVSALRAISPYAALAPLAWAEDPLPAWTCVVIWAAIGVAGIGLATWRLRPAALSEGVDRGARRRLRRRSRWQAVPEVDDARPMLWKERFIERAGTLGGIARWLGTAITLALFALTLACGAILAWEAGHGRAGSGWHRWAADSLEVCVEETSVPLALLIWASIGIRGAVAISSERERGTWDGLLTSPLEGGEIVLGKLVGSLRAVRWLVGAALLAWAVAMVAGVIPAGPWLWWWTLMAVVAGFMAAAGVRVSLACATATRAMGITLGVALLSIAMTTIASGVACLFVAFAFWAGWFALGLLGLIDAANTNPWFPTNFDTGIRVTRLALYAAATAAIVAETRLRFDRIAGRMTAGKAAVAVDRFFHGGPVRPVRDGLAKASPPALAGAGPGDQAAAGPSAVGRSSNA